METVKKEQSLREHTEGIIEVRKELLAKINALLEEYSSKHRVHITVINHSDKEYQELMEGEKYLSLIFTGEVGG